MAEGQASSSDDDKSHRQACSPPLIALLILGAVGEMKHSRGDAELSAVAAEVRQIMRTISVRQTS